MIRLWLDNREARYFSLIHSIQNDSGSIQSYSMGTGWAILGSKANRAKPDIPHLLPRLIMSERILLTLILVCLRRLY